MQLWNRNLVGRSSAVVLLPLILWALGSVVLWTAHSAYADFVVNVVQFSAELDGGQVVLTWETSIEEGVVGFQVYRGASPDGPFPDQVLPYPLPSLGNGGSYTAYDELPLTPGTTYWYALEALESIDPAVGASSTGVATAQLLIPLNTDETVTATATVTPTTGTAATVTRTPTSTRTATATRVPSVTRTLTSTPVSTEGGGSTPTTTATFVPPVSLPATTERPGTRPGVVPPAPSATQTRPSGGGEIVTVAPPTVGPAVTRQARPAASPAAPAEKAEARSADTGQTPAPEKSGTDGTGFAGNLVYVGGTMGALAVVLLAVALRKPRGPR